MDVSSKGDQANKADSMSFICVMQAEERRSARLGRDDDARAEMEELRHQEEKKRKKKKAKSNGLLM